MGYGLHRGWEYSVPYDTAFYRVVYYSSEAFIEQGTDRNIPRTENLKINPLSKIYQISNANFGHILQNRLSVSKTVRVNDAPNNDTPITNYVSHSSLNIFASLNSLD